MKKQQPIIDQSLADRADERERANNWRTAAGIASFLVNVGLAISAILTIFYLMLLVNDAAGLPSPYGYLFGLLVGVVAIVPAELALVIWRARLAADDTITKEQRVTAVIAMILAGVFSALTTSSFFSYFLPQLFPPSYMAIAPALNVGAIVGAWVVFILAIVAYSVGSRQTQQNLSQAKAHQAVFDARMTVLKSAAEAIRIEAESMVDQMDQAGVFRLDAQNLILASLGMEDGRLSALPAPSAATTPPAQQTDRDRRERLAMAATGTNVNGAALVANEADGPETYDVQVQSNNRWVTAVECSHYDDAVSDANERFDEGETAVRVVHGGGVAHELGTDGAADKDESWRTADWEVFVNGARVRSFPVRDMNPAASFAQSQMSDTNDVKIQSGGRLVWDNGHAPIANFTNRPGDGR